MPGFSSVDSSPDPSALIAYLDSAARGLASIKQYVAVAHALREPDLAVLDVGCGAGHDLGLLAGLGLRAVGLEPSATLAAEARRRLDPGIPLVRGLGEALPFRDRSLGGCRIERVLIHVADPRLVVREVVRCLAPGALLTMFEPDWTRLTVDSDVLPEGAAWMTGVHQPDAGARLWGLAEDAGCEVLDRVEEVSVWRDLYRDLDAKLGLKVMLARAAAAGPEQALLSRRWLEEQKRRQSEGRFRATMTKALIVARKGGS